MNISTLLNRQPSLLVSTTKLTSLVLKNNRQEIEAKSLLLKKRKEISKQRIKTFAGLQADANFADKTNNALLGGGLATGGGLSLLRGKKPVNNIRPFRRPIKPGKFSGLRSIGGRISKGNVITNTLFAGLDFANRKSAGQTNLQAGLGAGGGAVGGIAGAAIGQALIPIPVLGALIGGFVGANIGSGLADRASGVTGSDSRRLQLERESIRASGRTEFTEGLDRFDSALDKFQKYDDDLRGFLLRKPEGDGENFAFNPIIPRRDGATQKQIDSAYQKGIGMGIGGLATAVIGTVAAIKLGGFFLTGAAFAKLKALLGLVVKGKGKIDVKVLSTGAINKIIKKNLPKVTRSRTKPFKFRKRLDGQDKVTFSDKKDVKTLIELSKEANKQQIKIIKKYNKIRSQRLERKIEKITGKKTKSLEQSNNEIMEFMKKQGFDESNPLFKFIQKGKNLKSDNTIIKEGDNYYANNTSGGTTVIKSEEDPYLSSLNTIKAYSELTA